MDEYDARQFLSVQKGTYFLQPLTRSSGQSSMVEYFKYDTSYNFARPKASYAYKIHYPGIITKWNADITWAYELLLALNGNVTVFPQGLYENNIYYRNFINEGMPYKTNLLAGKNPWYDSYDQFFEELRPLSLNRAILPEYTFSKHADYYLKDKALDNYNKFLHIIQSNLFLNKNKMAKIIKKKFFEVNIPILNEKYEVLTGALENLNGKTLSNSLLILHHNML